MYKNALNIPILVIYWILFGDFLVISVMTKDVGLELDFYFPNAAEDGQFTDLGMGQKLSCSHRGILWKYMEIYIIYYYFCYYYYYILLLYCGINIQ
jgi:hypothetical protein